MLRIIRTRSHLFAVLAALGASGLAACSEPAEATTAEDACEHMLEAGTAITATDDSAADAPDITESHLRHDVTLAGAAGSLGGYVDLVIAEQGEYSVFLGADVPVALYDQNGAAVAAEVTAAVAACAEVSTSHTYDLAVGTYRMSFGPTAQTQVAVIYIAEGDAHD